MSDQMKNPILQKLLEKRAAAKQTKNAPPEEAEALKATEAEVEGNEPEPEPETKPKTTRKKRTSKAKASKPKDESPSLSEDAPIVSILNVLFDAAEQGGLDIQVSFSKKNDRG